ncbi:hypothetical protein [Streptomyces sp. DT203]
MVSGLIEHFGSRELAADAAVVRLDRKSRSIETARHTASAH